ncbi:MAG: hypothetical protein VB875_06160 [Pirellulales bacterium]
MLVPITAVFTDNVMTPLKIRTLYPERMAMTETGMHPGDKMAEENRDKAAWHACHALWA